MKKKGLVIAASVMLVLCLAVGGTLAWLMDTSGPVTNTFTYGDINITLAETTTNYKMVPGSDIAKDPKVTVEANSEACYLFVKIEKNGTYDSYLEAYVVADGWTKHSEAGNTAVYYREVSANDAKAGVEYPVLKDNKVVVKGEGVTKAMMEAIDGVNEDASKAEAELANRPTLTFTAYAVQSANVANATTAWGYVNAQ